MKRNQKGEIVTVLVIASVVAITAGVTILANVLTSSKQTTQTKAGEIQSCKDGMSQCITSSGTTVYDCDDEYPFWCIDYGNNSLCCKLPTATPTVAPTVIPTAAPTSFPFPNLGFSCDDQWAKDGNITTTCTYYDKEWYGNCRLRADLHTNDPSTRKCCDDRSATIRMNGARGEYGGCAANRYVSEQDAGGQANQPTPTPIQLTKLACQYEDDPTCELCNVNPKFVYNNQSYILKVPTKCDDYCRTQYTLPHSKLTGSRCPVEDSLKQPPATTKALSCTSIDQNDCELCQRNPISNSFTFEGKSYTWFGHNLSRVYCTNWCAQDGNVTKDEIPNSYCTNDFKNKEAAIKSIINPNQVVRYKCGKDQNQRENCNKCNYPEDSRNKQNYIVKWITRAGCPSGRNPVAQDPTIGIPNEISIKFFMDKPIGIPFCELEDNPVDFTYDSSACAAAGCKNNEKNCQAIKCKGEDEFYNLVPGSCK